MRNVALICREYEVDVVSDGVLSAVLIVDGELIRCDVVLKLRRVVITIRRWFIHDNEDLTLQHAVEVAEELIRPDDSRWAAVPNP